MNYKEWNMIQEKLQMLIGNLEFFLLKNFQMLSSYGKKNSNKLHWPD